MKFIKEFLNKNLLGNDQCFCGSYRTREVSWVTNNDDLTWNWKYFTCLSCNNKFTLEKKRVIND